MSIENCYRPNYWLRQIPGVIFWPIDYRACMRAAFLFQPAIVIIITKALLSLPATESLSRINNRIGVAYFILGLLTIFRAHSNLKMESGVKIEKLFIALYGWCFWSWLLVAIFLPMSM